VKQGTTYAKTVGTSSVQLCDADPFRTRLIFHPNANNRVTISDHSGVVLDAGPTLQPGQAPLVWCVAEVGLLVTKQLFAIASVAGVVVGITEASAESQAEFDASNLRKW
jgi:hypothetical protein